LRRQCQKLLPRAEKSPLLAPCDWAVKLGFLRSDTFADPAPLLKLVHRLEKSAADDEFYPWYMASSGLARYREKKYDQAAALLERGRAVKTKAPLSAVLLDVVAAMTRAKQGKADEALRLLAGAEKEYTTHVQRGAYWLDLEQLRVLLEEARRVVGKP
jgi:hypothetical protein